MKKILLIILILSFADLGLNAQPTAKAIGIRCGLSSGFEYRYFTEENNSYKILLSTRSGGVQLTVMKEFHRYDIFDFSEKIVFVYGLGIHAGFEHRDNDHFLERPHYEPSSKLLAGLDALAAIEYNFIKLPLIAGLEAKPFFDVGGRNIFNVELFDFAMTLKYTF